MSEKITPWQEYKNNLGTTRFWDLLSKDNYTNKETANTRMNICLKCPELLSVTHQCKKCGCLMDLKTKLIEASCPLGKW